MKNNSCPACHSKLSLRSLFAYSTLYGTRRILPCPNCGVHLRWRKHPFFVMNLGSGVLIAAAISVFALSERFFDGWNTPTILFSIGAVVTVASLRWMRLETSGKDSD